MKYIPNIKKPKNFLLFNLANWVLLFSVIISFSVSSIAMAAGEKLIMNSSYTTITGSGGIFSDKKIGGVYISSTFTKISGDTYKSDNPKRGDTVSSDLGCSIELTVPRTDSLKVTEAKFSSCTRKGEGVASWQVDQNNEILEGALLGLRVTVENKDGSTATDKVHLDKITGAIGGTLNPLKHRYYQSLGSKAPCGSSGCDDSNWNRMVYTCWKQGDEAAIHTGRVTPGGVDVDALSKKNMTRCIVEKTNLSEKEVSESVNQLNMGDIRKGRSEATQQIKDEEREEKIAECESQDLVLDDVSGECAEPKSSCAIDYVGWIICPVVNAAASMADKAYEFLSKSFLTVPASYLSEQGGLFKAWQIFQNIANVILVILFMFIVFSQLTSYGMDNYGVKKILPKLIIVAILMNLSFIISSIAVDISNIMGYATNDVLRGVADNIEPAVVGDNYYNPGSTGSGAAGNWGFLAAGALAGTIGVAASGGITLALVALIPVLLTALIAIVVIFFILVGRQVAIILLIAISPIAFAMYILPNTTQFFTMWRKMFTSLLLVFPIIGLVYGASYLAARVMSTAYANDQNLNVMGEIITAGIMIIPLITVPSILKKSLNGIANISGKVNAGLGKFSSGVDSKVSGSKFNRNLEGASARRAAGIGAGTYKGLNPISRGRSAINRGLNKSSAFNRATGGYGQLRASAGASLASAQDAEELKAADAWINEFRDSSGNALSHDDKFELATNGFVMKEGKRIEASSVQRRAAMGQLAGSLTGKQAMQLANATSDGRMVGDATLRKAAASTVAQSSSKVGFVGGKSIADMEAGKYNESEAITNWATNSMNEDNLAGMDAEAIRALDGVAAGNQSVDNAVNGAIRGIESNADLSSKITGAQAKAFDEHRLRRIGSIASDPVDAGIKVTPGPSSPLPPPKK